MADIVEQAQGIRSQRKRKRVSYSCDGVTTSPLDNKGQETLLSLASTCSKLVVFSGSGLSASSGMSTFSTKGGLYERAQKRFSVSNGKKLFTYSFYEKRKLEALAFFADIYAEARKAKPGLGHKALAQIAGAHKLLRHYTMNIDGLAESAGMDTWHVDNNPDGLTVEMHGNINQLVCPSCGVVVMMTPVLLRKLKSKKAIPCTKCDCEALRCRIMLYDDGEDDVITPEDVFDLMEEDVQQADLVLWVGISFEQSASTAYFRRVRQYLMEGRRQGLTSQAVINTSEEAVWNLMSACSNTGSMDVLEVLGSSDVILPMLATAMSDPACSPLPGCTPAVDPQLQPSLQPPQACETGPQPQPDKRPHSAAVKDETPQQSGDAAGVAASAQPRQQTRAAGQAREGEGQLHHDAGQLQHDEGQLQPARGQSQHHAGHLQDGSGNTSAGHAQDGPSTLSERLQPAPDAQTTGYNQNGLEDRPTQTTSAKPGGPPQEEIPIWLWPTAPLPDQGQLSLPQLRQRQEIRREAGGHAMQAGLALTTMRPPCIPQAPLQQAFGQIVAPVDQQQLPQDLLQHSGIVNGNSDSRTTTTNVVAPVYVQRDRLEAGMSSVAEQTNSDQGQASPKESVYRGDCQAQEAADATHDLYQRHDQAELRPFQLRASGTGQFGGVLALERSRIAVPGEAKHEQAQHAQRAQRGEAKHAQQAKHAAGSGTG
ncbi:hypothetical protein ABBQ38_005680 [Trebouxia sp. C0009 RCD-2024]